MSDAAPPCPWPMQTLRVPAVLMRGGTSRGLIFRASDLPADPALRDAVFLAALGSPHARQLDGVGAGDSHCSKIAILHPTPGAETHLDFTFGEVAVHEARVDYAGNSGNIISAVGLFAVEEGWVEVEAPQTTVRIHNTNTGKRIDVVVPVRDGRPAEEGDFAIDGVPGAAARIEMRFPRPEGALTGRLLPTGQPCQPLALPEGGTIEATLLDAANPVLLLPGEALGVTPQHTIAALNADAALLERIQKLRAQAAVAMGLVSRQEDAWAFSNMVPFPVLLFPPATYARFDAPERNVAADGMDLCVRVISMGMAHKSINVTVSVALTSAALVEGTLAHRLSGGVAAQTGSLRGNMAAQAGHLRGDMAAQAGHLRIGHPSGVIATTGALAQAAGDVGDAPGIAWVGLGRTARRIMEGNIVVQPHRLRDQWKLRHST